MESPSFILLVCLTIQCHGSTHFHYLKKGQEVTLSCETCQWEADVNSDNSLDCSLSRADNYLKKSKCLAAEPDLCSEIKRSTSKMCDISVKRGFFACVQHTNFDSCFFYPFKPSVHHVESFIVAQEEPDMVSDPVVRSPVHVSAGGSINLTCIFTRNGSYSNQRFVVYWIKTAAESNTCVYSFHLGAGYESGIDAHCAIDKDLLLRRSNTSKPSQTTNTHNLTISNATHSDSGQYVCALQVNINDQQHWRVITNTTVTVGDTDSVKPDVYTEDSPTTTGITTVDTDPLPIYVAGIVVPIILIVVVVIILLRRRSAGTKVHQTVISQSYQHGEEEDGDDDCSPYAVSQREQEPMYSVIQLPEQKTDSSPYEASQREQEVTYSVVQLPEQKTDHSTSGDGELASEPSGNKTTMKKNSIYDSSGP